MTASSLRPRRWLDIGVIGWWNYDNDGDLAMLAALRQGLAPHRVVPIDTGFPAHPDAIRRLNELDYVLLGGGTLITGKPTAPFDTFDQWADQLVCPLGVVGLGVDPFAEQYWPAVDALLNRAQFVYVRDQASRALLHDHPKVRVGPDLTFAYPLPARKDGPRDAASVPLCGVNLRRSALSGLDPAPWVEAISSLPLRVRGVSLSSFGHFNESALLRQVDPEGPQRFDAALYRQLDLVIGTAFHSILFAVQAVVPVIAIDYGLKVRNFLDDVGLTHYLLTPSEYHKLPGLVEEVLAHRAEITDELRGIRERLCREAQRNFAEVREQIESSEAHGDRQVHKVTVIVLSSGDTEKDERTLASCASQTYRNVAVLYATHMQRSALPRSVVASGATLVQVSPQASPTARLLQILVQTDGEYLTWIDGGDWFARDALGYLVSRLEKADQRDVVYADYYMMDEANIPLGYQTVPGPDKLYRRDVVGPCFLMRSRLLNRIGLPAADVPLAAYDLWLRARSKEIFLPCHAPLFYSTRQFRSRAFVEQERAVRRRWRGSKPAWLRAAWRVIDTDLGERFVVQPAARLSSLVRRVVHDKLR